MNILKLLTVTFFVFLTSSCGDDEPTFSFCNPNIISAEKSWSDSSRDFIRVTIDLGEFDPDAVKEFNFSIIYYDDDNFEHPGKVLFTDADMNPTFKIPVSEFYTAQQIQKLSKVWIEVDVSYNSNYEDCGEDAFETKMVLTE